jgi:hypothetical protein
MSLVSRSSHPRYGQPPFGPSAASLVRPPSGYGQPGPAYMDAPTTGPRKRLIATCDGAPSPLVPTFGSTDPGVLQERGLIPTAVSETDSGSLLRTCLDLGGLSRTHLPTAYLKSSITKLESARRAGYSGDLSEDPPVEGWRRTSAKLIPS